MAFSNPPRLTNGAIAAKPAIVMPLLASTAKLEKL